jgi:hypothetical protein
MNAATFDADWSKAAFDNPSTLLANAPRKRASADEIKMIEAALFPFHDEATRPRIYEDAGGTVTRASSTSEYELLSPSDLLSKPTMRDLVRGVLPREGIAAIIGSSMAGKGFIIFDLMAILAEGGVWFECLVDRVPVVYVALEGAGGLPKRIKAWEEHNGRKYPEIRIITQSLDLRNAVQVDALIDAIRVAGFSGGVLVIDTLAQGAPGMDENSSRDMGEVIASLKHIQQSIGGLVVAIHHLGKDSTRGPRGHSSFLAGLDASIEVRRQGDHRSWVVAKAKDDIDGGEHPFRLQVVEIDSDEDGQPITSCVVVAEESAANAVRRAKVPKGGNQKAIYDVAGELLRQGKNMGQGGAPSTRPCIRMDDLIAACRGRLAVDNDRIPERVRIAVTGLINNGCIVFRNDWIWLP